MKSFTAKAWLAGLLALLGAAVNPPAYAAGPHFVFAHYMVCYATYGQSLQGYERDIQEAQAAGIDGFALNVGAWSGPDTYYKSRVALLYSAAEQLGTGFKLFFSLDLGNTNDILDMISSYAARTNTFRYNGKVVVSTFGQNGLDWVGSVFQPLKQQGIPVFFIPHFWPNPVHELPSFADGVGILKTYTNLLDGLFWFGAAGLPVQLAQCNSNYTAAVHQAGKVFMASVSPHYWGNVQYSIGRRYFEFDGGEGTVLQWSSIILNQPDWVEITTWNDFNESTYSSPVNNPEQYEAQVTTPHRYSHAGFLELSKRYIAWYKTGQAPPVNQEGLFYFYRTHPKTAVASDTNDVAVTWINGTMQDTLYATALLTAPANLEIASGSNLTTNLLVAGLNQIRVPFLPGTQKLTLRRSGQAVFTVQGPDILSHITNYDFFPASGFGYGPPANPMPPTSLQAN